MRRIVINSVYSFTLTLFLMMVSGCGIVTAMSCFEGAQAYYEVGEVGIAKGMFFTGVGCVALLLGYIIFTLVTLIKGSSKGDNSEEFYT